MHYFLYAFERYQSFREVSSAATPSIRRIGMTTVSTYLIKTKSPDGLWNSTTGVATDTCFALLFLLRSSQKSIEQRASPGAGHADYGARLARGERYRAAHGPGAAKTASRTRPSNCWPPSKIPAIPTTCGPSKGWRKKSKRPRRSNWGNWPGVCGPWPAETRPEPARGGDPHPRQVRDDLNNVPIIIVGLSGSRTTKYSWRPKRRCNL